MEPEGLLTHLQEPTNCHCLEPDQSSPWPPPHFLKVHLNIILPPTPGSQKGLFPTDFPAKTSSPSYVLHVLTHLLLIKLIGI